MIKMGHLLTVSNETYACFARLCFATHSSECQHADVLTWRTSNESALTTGGVSTCSSNETAFACHCALPHPSTEGQPQTQPPRHGHADPSNEGRYFDATLLNLWSSVHQTLGQLRTTFNGATRSVL